MEYQLCSASIMPITAKAVFPRHVAKPHAIGLLE